MMEKTYIAIDLKSFYASVECVERGLDPLRTNLVVADETRTEKTICLAVSPGLKDFGVPGRPRLFEVIQKVDEINRLRLGVAPGRRLVGASVDSLRLREDPSLKLDYIVAKPQMAKYMDVSAQIYRIYLRYVASEDIHVYSIDEVFIDATGYLSARGVNGREFAKLLIGDVQRETGITATVGIGTNLYLCKIAMDIKAKHMPADADGMRIAELDEASYRREFWGHRPLTDFWRIGRGYASKLEAHGVFTMGDIARLSLESEDLLYDLFGINAELLIDHAWGWEPCTIADIKAYRSENNSISTGQVLQKAYSFDMGRLVVREMADQLVLDLVEKGLVTDQMVLTVGYDVSSLADPARASAYTGPVTKDPYGRKVPKSAHGSINLGKPTSSTRQIVDAVAELYDRIVDRRLLVRRMYVVANHAVTEETARRNAVPEQTDLFTDPGAEEKRRAAEAKELERERQRQEAVLGIKKKFGKNAILRGMNFREGATAAERNKQVGGHRA